MLTSSSTLSVTKADGTKQTFRRRKIVRTCIRLGARKEIAMRIGDKVESKVYDGMPTSEILKMIFDYLEEYQPAIRHQIDLRMAIALLRPKPDFERFIQIMLEEQGYKLMPNQIVRGRCVEHEIDAVARKGDDTYLVEIKHHRSYHTYTGLDVCRIAVATSEDIAEGHALGLNPIKFNKIMVVCNTKFSQHAKQYAKCKGIEHIGWKTPPGHGLDRVIDEKRLYPITLLKDLSQEIRERLADNEVLLLKQLTRRGVQDLAEKTRIPKDQLEDLRKRAKMILETCEGKTSLGMMRERY